MTRIVQLKIDTRLKRFWYVNWKCTCLTTSVALEIASLSVIDSIDNNQIENLRMIKYNELRVCKQNWEQQRPHERSHSSIEIRWSRKKKTNSWMHDKTENIEQSRWSFACVEIHKTHVENNQTPNEILSLIVLRAIHCSLKANCVSDIESINIQTKMSTVCWTGVAYYIHSTSDHTHLISVLLLFALVFWSDDNNVLHVWMFINKTQATRYECRLIKKIALNSNARPADRPINLFN